MVLKVYSILPQAPKLEPHHQMIVCHNQDTRCAGDLPLCGDTVGVWYIPSWVGWQISGFLVHCAYSSTLEFVFVASFSFVVDLVIVLLGLFWFLLPLWSCVLISFGLKLSLQAKLLHRLENYFVLLESVYNLQHQICCSV